MSSMDPGSNWMEDKLKDMELIMNEKFEEFNHPELDDFLTESCEPPGDGSSLISTSSSSPSSFASSFNESISEPLTDNGGKHANSPQLPPPDSSGGGELVEAVDFPGLNTEAEPVNTTVDVDVSTKLSKLPTPSKKLTNCSTLTRSPVKDIQLELMKEIDSEIVDSAPFTQSSLSGDKSQSSSGRSSTNDTYVLSSSSSEKKACELLSESGTSETSSVCSSLSVESMTGNKASRLSRTGLTVATKPAARTKTLKPSAKPSLLPSRALEKTSKTLLRQPLSKNSGTRKLVKPVGTLSKDSKLSLKHQENGGISVVASTAASRPTKRLPSNKSRSRRSSIPKPVAVSDLRKNQPSKDSFLELETTRVLSSASDPVIQSTPIPNRIKTGTESEVTPSRKRSTTTETPTRSGEFGDSGLRIRPSFSLSSIEGSDSGKANCPTPRNTGAAEGKTPKTVTKRRSLLPIPGGKEPTIPLTLGTPSKMSRDTHKQTSGSPQLDGDKQAMPPPKKSLKPRVMSSGLQKPRAGSSRLAFKPRNGPVSRIKKDGPVKPKAVLYGDDSEMVPKTGSCKLMHSPVNKENLPATPHSKWSPVKKKRDFNADDAFYRCTKRTAAN